MPSRRRFGEESFYERARLIERFRSVVTVAAYEEQAKHRFTLTLDLVPGGERTVDVTGVPGMTPRFEWQYVPAMSGHRVIGFDFRRKLGARGQTDVVTLEIWARQRPWHRAVRRPIVGADFTHFPALRPAGRALLVRVPPRRADADRRPVHEPDRVRLSLEVRRAEVPRGSLASLSAPARASQADTLARQLTPRREDVRPAPPRDGTLADPLKAGRTRALDARRSSNRTPDPR